MSSLRRSWIVHTLLVALLGLLVGEQSFVHVCPMHANSASDTSTASTATPQAHHGASSHEHHQSPKHQGACDCLAGCVAAIAVAIAKSVVADVPVEVTSEARPVAFFDELRTGYQHSRYVLPFSTAPPMAG